MGLFELFMMALGLSMDAFAVSVSNGMCYRGFGRKQAVMAATAFGFFQAMMPVIGYFAGRTFSDAISAFDHWVALILLGIIGGKMLFDGIKALHESESCDSSRTYTIRTLLMQAIATSIDALAVGVGLAVLHVDIFLAAGFIGCVTFCCCIAGAILGRRFGIILGHRAEICGGLILILIGLNIFRQG